MLYLLLGYIVSITVSWILFRIAITSEGEPELHPQGFLMFITFVPLLNIMVSLIAVIAFRNIKIDFFRTK